MRPLDKNVAVMYSCLKIFLISGSGSTLTGDLDGVQALYVATEYGQGLHGVLDVVHTWHGTLVEVQSLKLIK